MAMTELEFLSPGQVARELNISSSTLRRWSTEFADFLSESAGRPELSINNEPVHRRYSDQDLRILGSIGELLRRGLTYREVAVQLQRARRSIEAGITDLHDNELVVVPTAAEVGAVLSSSFSFLSGAMERVTESQQVVLNSQQVNRDLLGVVIQDNFNLKEENSNLRERILHLERDVSEIRRREESLRRDVMERLLDIEDRSQNTSQQADTIEAQSHRKGCLGKWFSRLF